MTRRLTLPVLLALVILLAGCSCAKDAAMNTAEVAAAGNDRYYTLATAILDGSVDAENGPAVTEADLTATPASVREFVVKLLTALHVNRVAWHSMLFQLDLGPDPDSLELLPVVLPEQEKPTDENDELLEDG